MVLFVPGYPEDRTSRDYDAVMRSIEAKGYEVVFIDMIWRHTTIDDWTKRLRQAYEQFNSQDVILAGFSYGAMTALAVAAENSPKELWLFSLSPYFKEDMPNLKQSWLNLIGKRRTETFSKLAFNDLAANLSCPVNIVAGELELIKYPPIGIRFREAKRQFRNCRFAVAKGAGHSVDHPSYIETVNRLIG